MRLRHAPDRMAIDHLCAVFPDAQRQCVATGVRMRANVALARQRRKNAEGVAFGEAELPAEFGDASRLFACRERLDHLQSLDRRAVHLLLVLAIAGQAELGAGGPGVIDRDLLHRRADCEDCAIGVMQYVRNEPGSFLQFHDGDIVR